MCTYKKREIYITDLDLKTFINNCATHINIYTVTLTPICTAIAIIFVIVFVYNAKLYRRIRFFKTRAFFHTNTPDGTCDRDVFICYNDEEDHDIVENFLCDGIEEMGLTTCLIRKDCHDSDSFLDEWIGNAIDRSRFVIFVMSPSLFDWVHIDLAIGAATRSKHPRSIIVIYIEEVNRDTIPIYLRLIISQNQFVDYVENNDNIFWTEMRRILTNRHEEQCC